MVILGKNHEFFSYIHTNKHTYIHAYAYTDKYIRTYTLTNVQPSFSDITRFNLFSLFYW